MKMAKWLKRGTFGVLGVGMIFSLWGCLMNGNAQPQAGFQDPLATRIYHLDNGLSVYLGKVDKAPRAQVVVAVNAGSTVEPGDSTGLAHYLEHLLFKGTDRLGTLNWEVESALLTQIRDQFERYRKSEDPAERQEIYAEIDRLSGEAARYSSGGEFFLLTDSLGATGTNAFTSYDMTAYVNDVPVNQLGKLLNLEAERMQHSVMRRFHTELETVYEEFNRAQDSDGRRAFSLLMKNLYGVHPYGRDIIGYPEHLKNPSLVNVERFFREQYVPGNMAVIIVGDIDFEETLRLVEQSFGRIPAGNAPETTPAPLLAGKAVSEDLHGPEAEMVYLGYRFPNTAENRRMVTLADSLLSYRNAGFLDVLGRSGNVQSASAMRWPLRDFISEILVATPREGQSLDEAYALLTGEIERLKRGEFEAWQLEAIANNLYYDGIVELEERGNGAMWLMQLFRDGRTPEEEIAELNALREVSKEELSAFVRENFKENYAVVFKRSGAADHVVKVGKPQITPVTLNEGMVSPWGERFMQIAPEAESAPEFPDFERDLQRADWGGAEFFYTHNPRNERFALQLVWPTGRWEDPALAIAMAYWSELGTAQFSADELKNQWFRLGVSLQADVGDNRTTITLSGPNRSLLESMRLLHQALTAAKNDPAIYRKVADRILKERENERQSPDDVYGALWNYGLYGADNPFRCRWSAAEIGAADPAALLARIPALLLLRHDVAYYGPDSFDTAAAEIRQALPVAEKAEPPRADKRFLIPAFDADEVLAVDFPMSQVWMMWVRHEAPFDAQTAEMGKLFSSYVGRAAFQELREARALAYVASAYVANARLPENSNMAVTMVQTQVDKMPEALQALLDFSAKAPQNESAFATSRDMLLENMRSDRVDLDGYYALWVYLKERQAPEEFHARMYGRLPLVTLEKFSQYFDRIAAGKGRLLVMGPLEKLDKKLLEKVGPLRVVTVDELF